MCASMSKLALTEKPARTGPLSARAGALKHSEMAFRVASVQKTPGCKMNVHPRGISVSSSVSNWSVKSGPAWKSMNSRVTFRFQGGDV